MDETIHDQFWTAVKAGDEEAVHRLVSDYRDLNAAHPEHGVSAVLIPLYHRHEKVARVLATRKREIDVFEAAALDDAEALERILAATPESANAYSDDGFTPLCLAAFFGRARALELLLEAGAAVDRAANNPMQV